MSFEIQIPHLSLKWHISKCHLRFRSLLWDSNDTFQKYHLRFRSFIWVSNETFQNVIWDSHASFESQMTIFKMSFEIQIPPLRLKWQFSKCHLRFRSLLWDSNDRFQKVIWDWDPSFETQMTLFKHVIWDSDASFESQMTLFKMSFEIQIPHLSLKYHFSKCCLRFRSLIWVSNDASKNVVEIQMQYCEQCVLRLRNFLNNHCQSSASAVAYPCHCHLGAHPSAQYICNTTIHLCIHKKSAWIKKICLC